MKFEGYNHKPDGMIQIIYLKTKNFAINWFIEVDGKFFLYTYRNKGTHTEWKLRGSIHSQGCINNKYMEGFWND